MPAYFNETEERNMQAQINGNEVFYTTHGQGRPMLLMHGGSGLDHTYFRPWLDSLGDRVELIYYDQLGNGRSTRPDSYEGIGLDTWADEADALRASLGHDRIILFGHSFGGFIAQKYALRHGDHLAGLILCDTAPALNYPEVIIGNAQARGTPEQVEMVVGGLSNPAALSDDALWRQAWRTILPLYFHNYDPKVGDAMDEKTSYSGMGFSHGFEKCLPTFNVLDRLGEISAPTLILGGQDDWITPPAYSAERLHAGLPHSKMVIFENSGHFPFIEENDKFLAAVRDWLASLPA
jgi:proline iminopeptidase